MKTAIITGSTSGIGLGVAECFANEGYNMMLNGFGDAAKIEQTRARLDATVKGKVGYHSADTTKADEIMDQISTSEAEFGPVDIAVNNAGIQHVEKIGGVPPEKWDAIIAINLISAFHTIRHALPGMKERGWGRIINVASAQGLVASSFKSAYVSVKHGTIGLTKTGALEGAEFGATCTAVCPGYVLTPLVEKQIPDTARARDITEEAEKRDVLLAAQPTKKFATVEQLCALCVFLTTDAAAQMTGTTLPVDGGGTAH